jgi:ATP-binding cassette subfamily B protein
VPQDVFLFSESIRENIAFSLDKGPEVERLTEEAAKRAQVHENIIGFPNSYDTQLGERGITLSGGQKQRVSIARAIANTRSILIFDDALSAVDTATEEAILRDLRQTSKGRTTVIISHRISAVRDADTIVVLEDGEVREAGDHETLLDQGGLYTRLYEEQLLEEARQA